MKTNPSKEGKRYKGATTLKTHSHSHSLLRTHPHTAYIHYTQSTMKFTGSEKVTAYMCGDGRYEHLLCRSGGNTGNVVLIYIIIIVTDTS